jgi:protease-4
VALEADLLVDRRRLKRRLAGWRAATVVAVVTIVAVALGRVGLLEQPHVARVRVDGIIGGESKLVQAVDALATDTRVKALIVAINSPGGSVAGGESLHDAIARVASRKPVVTVMGPLAASAGYMIAVPSARIWAREATLTGSIGVLLETGEISGLLDKIGVSTDTLVSGPLKGQPSFTRPLSPAGRAALQDLVDDMFDQFVVMVADGRHMAAAKVRGLADGRAYTGRQAVKLGLVDAIGGETDARDWLASRGIPRSIPVEDVQIDNLARRAFAAGFGPIWDGLAKILPFQGVTLDGPLAIWQPQ